MLRRVPARLRERCVQAHCVFIRREPRLQRRLRAAPKPGLNIRRQRIDFALYGSRQLTSEPFLGKLAADGLKRANRLVVKREPFFPKTFIADVLLQKPRDFINAVDRYVAVEQMPNDVKRGITKVGQRC